MKNMSAKKMIKRISAVAASMVILLGSSLVANAEAKYTYSYDYWGDVQDSPDAYEVIGVFDCQELGLPELVERLLSNVEEPVEEETEEEEEAEEEEAEEEEAEEEEAEAEAEEGSEEGGEGGEEGSEEGESKTGRRNQKADLHSPVISNTSSSITVVGNYIYLCDSGNNRIIKIERLGREQFKAVDIFWKINGNVKDNTFDYPTDIQFDEDGNIYVADNNNERVVKMDSNWTYIMEFNKPNDSTFEKGQDFLPNKIAVDTAGRIYCVADNVNKGLLKYEADGTFAGFNTAYLAEIGKRLDKNIKLVQVSSVGRATALSSGTVDVVFWTRSCVDPSTAKMSGEDFIASVEKKGVFLAEKERHALRDYLVAVPPKKYSKRDMPAGTIITNPYFTDMPVAVMLKK